MRIEINYQAESLEAAICEAIVTYLGCGMPACEIIDQLISRGLILFATLATMPGKMSCKD